MLDEIANVPLDTFTFTRGVNLQNDFPELARGFPTAMVFNDYIINKPVRLKKNKDLRYEVRIKYDGGRNLYNLSLVGISKEISKEASKGVSKDTIIEAWLCVDMDDVNERVFMMADMVNQNKNENPTEDWRMRNTTSIRGHMTRDERHHFAGQIGEDNEEQFALDEDAIAIENEREVVAVDDAHLRQMSRIRGRLREEFGTLQAPF